MKFQADEIVFGATRFAGNIDGKEISSAKVFTEASLDKPETGFGRRTIERTCADIGVVDRIKHLPFPMVATVFYEERASKDKSQLMVVDVKPHGNQPAGLRQVFQPTPPAKAA